MTATIQSAPPEASAALDLRAAPRSWLIVRARIRVVATDESQRKACPGRFTPMSGRGADAPKGDVKPTRLETILKHDGRLNLLCCLLDAGPLSVPQLAARIGESTQTVSYWTRLLDSFGLVARRGEPAGGELQYAASLDDHPEWVREAVRRHRPRTI